MMTPTIHLNGTSREELIAQLANAADAIDRAVDAVNRACPNARDYYPQGPGAFTKAMAEHNDRMLRLRSVQKELEDLAVAIDSEGLEADPEPEP